jgi:DNA polymerase III subunit beta
MILPRKTVLELNRLLVDTDDALEITLATNQVRLPSVPLFWYRN